MKLEGILRDFCLLNDKGIITSKIEPRNGLIKRERDINNLLYDEKLQQIIPKDDLEYLKIVLIEQTGYHQRNDVAHSLISYQSYGILKMNNVILAILRLSKYNFKKNLV